MYILSQKVGTELVLSRSFRDADIDISRYQHYLHTSTQKNCNPTETYRLAVQLKLALTLLHLTGHHAVGS